MFRASGVVDSDRALTGLASETTNVTCLETVAETSRPARFHEYLETFLRFWGIFTAVVLGSVGVDLIYHKHKVGYYEIGAAIFILLLEVLWVVTAFLRLCVRSDHCIWRWWSTVLWLRGWKKTLLYGPLAAIPFVWPQKLWLSYVASGQLIFLAFAYFLMSLKVRRRKRRREQLLNGDIDSIESRIDEVTDIAERILEPIPGSSISLADSLTRHDNILEI